MCGKFSQIASWRAARDYADFLLADGRAETVTPMRLADILILNETGTRMTARMRWGIPKAGAYDLGPGHMHARAETIDEKPAFRDAFRHRRGLAVVKSFNVARRTAPRKTEQFVIASEDGNPLGLAVIWQAQKDEAGRPFLAFAMASTPANALIEPVTDRMPAVISPEDWGKWLGESTASLAELKALLAAYDGGADMTPEKRRANPKPVGPQPELF